MARREHGGGLRILVVEDELLVADMIAEALLDLGCVVVGPTGRLDTALNLAREELLDAAVLDVAIRGGVVTPVADQLRARDIPFLIASGREEPGLKAERRLDKPFTLDALRRWVHTLPA